MKKVNMKNTELALSNICYGTANFGEKLDAEEAFRLLDNFVDLGGNFIDTANVYCRWIPGMENSSERMIGAWLRERGAYSKIVVATKGGHYDLDHPEVSRVSREGLWTDLEESLRTLGLNCIDLYWLHRDDETKEIGEIMEIMESLVKCGKIRYYGASNFKQSRMEEARLYAGKHGLQGFSAVSNQWSLASENSGIKQDPSLVKMDAAYYEWHKDKGVPMVPYSSAAHGYFTKMEKGTVPDSLREIYGNERNGKIFASLERMSKESGFSVYSLAQAYLLQHSFQVFPVASVSGADQLKEFQAASEMNIPVEWCQELLQYGVE